MFLYLLEIFHDYVKYVIVGFIKCGQVSLKKKLESEGHEVRRFECATNPLGPRMIKKLHPGFEPVIITRDPIKRIWSQYKFLSEKFDYEMTFEQYCHYWNHHLIWFNENPIFQSNYDEHLKHWDNPLVYELEECIKDPAFPKENEGENKTKMSDEDRELATTMLKDYKSILQGKLTVKGTGVLDK